MSFIRKHKTAIIISVIGGVCTAFLVGIIAAAFSVIISEPSGVLYMMLGVIILLLFSALAGAALISKGMRSSLSNLGSDIDKIKEKLERLPGEISGVEWATDGERFEEAIYGRMIELIKNLKTLELRVFSIFKPGAEPKSDDAKGAAEEYYKAIEEAVVRYDATYKRAVIVRRSLRKGVRHPLETEEERRKADEKNIRDAFRARPQFLNHYLRIIGHSRQDDSLEGGANDFKQGRAAIKVYPDDGRIMDIAFAIFSQEGKAVALVLEIEIYGSLGKEGVRGLLVMNQAQAHLMKPCIIAFSNLFEDSLLPHIPVEQLLEALGDLV